MGLEKTDIYTLRKALRIEQRYAAMHESMEARFGPLPELSDIISAEKCHVQVLGQLHRRYGLHEPAARAVHLPRYVSPSDACCDAIASEAERADEYQRLIGAARESTIVAELRNLERASRVAHLPALLALERRLRRAHRERAQRP